MYFLLKILFRYSGTVLKWYEGTTRYQFTCFSPNTYGLIGLYALELIELNYVRESNGTIHLYDEPSQQTG